MRSYPEESSYKAALRFGFGQLGKIRHESNLTSLPIQYLEVFFLGLPVPTGFARRSVPVGFTL